MTADQTIRPQSESKSAVLLSGLALIGVIAAAVTMSALGLAGLAMVGTLAVFAVLIVYPAGV